ncbi:dihydrodipicolinate synthase family protein [Nesterenkonia sp. LB17]|uniref:dihydrodipicolinate synthase family protein n=1 Tax=Nesterenkonia sp. LB17 TaxID=2901230 RepID=UPI001F4CC06D|nr:dihydrodipicolinate synthase family protein [Nesterenkonia sp. LB17]MCH8565270.1 dihydrodipicolinate synthase family protein [Nesterenkonia sp. LB17]
MFKVKGLSAFPLTPITDDEINETSFAGLIERLANTDVDSITALGSTGSYAYLTAPERARAAQLAVEHSGGKPVIVGVGALRTSQILINVDGAEAAGASAILLAPMTYQALSALEVYEIYHTVALHTKMPIIVYDNPSTTRFKFTPSLYGEISQIPNITSIKIPAISSDIDISRKRIDAIRNAVPQHITIGISGDPVAAAGLNAGCDAWYSVLAGTVPQPALAITRAAQQRLPEVATAESHRLAPLWTLFSELGGSLRVIAAVAEHYNLAPENCLPRPIQGLSRQERARVAMTADSLNLDP